MKAKTKRRPASTRRAGARRSTVGREIVEGLREFVDALRNGKKIDEVFTCRTISLDVPPAAYDAAKVAATRKLLGASQAIFAQFLGVNVKTVQSWEAGNAPGEMACRFLDEIRADPGHWRKRLGKMVRIKAEA